MSLRIHCQACGTAFLTTDDHLGRSVACPKCAAEQVVPASVALDEPGRPVRRGASAWIPSDDLPDDEPPSTSSRRRRWIAASLLLAIPILAVAALVGWPQIRELGRPSPPPDPTEQVAAAYLRALVDGNTEVSGRLGTIDETPAIRSFGEPRLDPVAGRTVRGSFAPIAALHQRIESEFEYDPALGRFKARNPLGPAAETLDSLHEARDQAEQQDLYAKMASGDPDDIFDAAEQFGSLFTKLASGPLKPEKLVPTYAQLVETADPPLPVEAKALASAFADDQELFDALLKRPFPTLKSDGPFILEQAVVLAPVRDTLASAGDPPSTLRLGLTRFRLEGIDTGWRVTSARRVVPESGDPGAPSGASDPPSSSEGSH